MDCWEEIRMTDFKQLRKLKEYPEEAMSCLKQLAVIPAPSGKEEKRRDFCRKWLSSHGVLNAFSDEAGNLIIPFDSGHEGSVTMVLAHLDVVFPDEEALPWHEDEKWLGCPGIGDNTVHAVDLMMAATELTENKILPERGALYLVLNVSEEGLGNLKGSRQLVKDYGHKISRFITLDSVNREIVTRAVGSCRFRVKAFTEGGHSFRDFGKANAIECLAALIERLYERPVPEEGMSSKNVGKIEGGTSVNTIAQEAEMLYECRSDHKESMESMTRELYEEAEKLEKEARAAGKSVKITPELIGERPCMAAVDETEESCLIRKAQRLIRKWYQEEPYEASGSTDANASLSEGIPSVCFGACRGEGAHTRQERIRRDSLLPGLCLVRELIMELIAESR